MHKNYFYYYWGSSLLLLLKRLKPRSLVLLLIEAQASHAERKASVDVGKKSQDFLKLMMAKNLRFTPEISLSDRSVWWNISRYINFEIKISRFIEVHEGP